MTATKEIPSVAEVCEAATKAFDKLRALTFHKQYIIQDYPIGRRDRGMCKLEVEFHKSKGYRTVRTTSRPSGRWCKPKKSIYSDSPHVVVSGDGVDKEAGWLFVGDCEIGVRAACLSSITYWYRAPHHCLPSREAVTYRVETRSFGGAVSREDSSIPPDPAELCDAFDAWLAIRKEALSFLRSTIESIS